MDLYGVTGAIKSPDATRSRLQNIDGKWLMTAYTRSAPMPATVSPSPILSPVVRGRDLPSIPFPLSRPT